MYTDITYQDWLLTPEYDRPALLLKIIRQYKASPEFKLATTANQYFRAENPTVAKKTILRARKMEYTDDKGRKRVRSGTKDVVGNRIFSGFFFRFVTQQNQFLLANGVTLEEPIKKKLGADFDNRLEQLGERALIQGVAWGFWNADHLEIIEAAKDALSGAVALVDEQTSAPMVLVQFWQINARRPLYIRLFTLDGVVVYRVSKDDKVEELEGTRRAYIVHTMTDVLGTVELGGSNYARLPAIPLYASSEQRSELTPAIKAKIDAYDNILSDFGDNLDRANDVYWVLNNFGGTMDDVAELLEQIQRVKAVANLSDGTGTSSTAEPRTIEVPYAAREKALDILEKALYSDYMALNMDELTGGSLTNVAIRAASANFNIKADRYEWQVRAFVSNLLDLIGSPSDDIRFDRQTIANESEMVQDIALMRDYIDMETALKLNPHINDEEIEAILERVAAESMNAAPMFPEPEQDESEVI